MTKAPLILNKITSFRTHNQQSIHLERQGKITWVGGQDWIILRTGKVIDGLP